MSQASVLAPFYQNGLCFSAMDALGCRLMKEGKPICFVSRSLAGTQRNYAEFEKAKQKITDYVNHASLY